MTQGEDHQFTQATARIVVTPTDRGISIGVDGDTSWDGAFAVPSGNELGTGTWETGSQTSAYATWTGEGRGCGERHGWFSIDELERDGQGELSSLTVRYEQACGGNPASHVKVHWVRDDPTRPAGPAPIPSDLRDLGSGTPTDRSYLIIDGDARSGITDDRTFTYTQQNATFSVEDRLGGLEIQVAGPERWRAVLAPMYSLTQVEEGYYAPVEDMPGNDPAKGGMTWSGTRTGGLGNTCDSTGWYAVDEITRGSVGIDSLTVRFELLCARTNTPIVGKLHWVASDPTTPPLPVVPVPDDLWDTAPPVPAGQDYMSVQTTGDDPFTRGQGALVTPSGGLSLFENGSSIDIGTQEQGGWQVTVSGVEALGTLTPGLYPGIVNVPRDNPAGGGLSLNGNGAGCNGVAGWFAIDHISRSGTTLTGLDLRMEMSCDGRPVVQVKVRAGASAGHGSAPIGALEAVTSAAGSVEAVGWALDPDQPDTDLAVQVEVDGAPTTGRTSTLRSGVPGAPGPARGFTIRAAAGAGPHTICAFAIDTANAARSPLGCTQTQVLHGSPFGSVDVAEGAPGAIVVAGWAIDPDTAHPIDVHLYIDNNGTALTAGSPRPDVAAAFPGYGPNHGYNATITAPPGQHTLCAYGINRGTGGNSLISCRQVTVPGGSPFGSVDVAEGAPGAIVVAGWAIDPDTAHPIDVHLYIDNNGTALTAGSPRPDVAAAFPGYGPNHGYNATITAPPGQHTLCAYGINRGTGGNSLISCRQVTVPGGSPFGSVDVAQGAPGAIVVAGWAIDPDTAHPIDVHLYIDNNGTALTAGSPRPDVAAAFPGYGPNHGYNATITAPPGQHTLCAYGINRGTGGNSLISCRQVRVN